MNRFNLHAQSTEFQFGEYVDSGYMSNIDTSNSKQREPSSFSFQPLDSFKSPLDNARVLENFLISKFIRGGQLEFSKILTVLEIIN